MRTLGGKSKVAVRIGTLRHWTVMVTRNLDWAVSVAVQHVLSVRVFGSQDATV